MGHGFGDFFRGGALPQVATLGMAPAVVLVGVTVFADVFAVLDVARGPAPEF